ncbi:hypothetical protein PYCCODRAFT_1436987 [Trametes coccinea BRFM310]|uniref:Uncharacterized protein n=1 Tax=Trametes coccinea (strain BRFM310) TaxID=1353009 RepID=A0A1Y2IIJ0_TRAC3|nr:hypothetical protein PYCCODRAFT_1436987 [Trametes coccinea BRFM310]
MVGRLAMRYKLGPPSIKHKPKLAPDRNEEEKRQVNENMCKHGSVDRTGGPMKEQGKEMIPGKY